VPATEVQADYSSDVTIRLINVIFSSTCPDLCVGGPYGLRQEAGPPDCSDGTREGQYANMKHIDPAYRAQRIWKMSEQVAHLLRNATRLELKDRHGNLLTDKLSEKQNVMVSTVRALCLKHPKGITLKEIAAQLGISSAAASVMVDALTVNGLLVRKTASEDRRAVQIKLSPKAEAFFELGDRTILKHVLRVGESLGSDVLVKWHDVLLQVQEFLTQDL
jgi:DNA-binding MarR family transcriptional regulator